MSGNTTLNTAPTTQQILNGPVKDHVDPLLRDFASPKYPVPSLAYALGAALFIAVFVQIAVHQAEVKQTYAVGSISYSVGFAVGACCSAYVGAVMFGFFAMLCGPIKVSGFWKDDFPGAIMLWTVGLSCCYLFVVCGLHLKQFVATPDIAGRMKEEISSGRFPFWLALSMFSIRTAWSSLFFKLPEMAFSQYIVFYMVFVSLMTHHQFEPAIPNPGGSPALPAASSFVVLILVRKWRLVERLWQGKVCQFTAFDGTTLFAGNVLVGASVAWGMCHGLTEQGVTPGMFCLRVFLCCVIVGFCLLSGVAVFTAVEKSKALNLQQLRGS